ncbi:hypothetical protein HMPREF2714_02155 [Corynebacterium sp. HMSC077G01]|nr:hypothetical protein HMPREF2714_02155 [Corynebacterium sp. HMSC077G01]
MWRIGQTWIGSAHMANERITEDLVDGKLRRGGKSVSAVARTFNVSRPTIYRALKRIDADA